MATQPDPEMSSPLSEMSSSLEDTAKQPLIVAAMTPLAPLPPVSGHGDLELRILQAVSEYAGHGLVRSYSYVKQSSRALGFVASSTEIVVTKVGLVALVKFLYEQYLRLGHPIVRYVDEAIGRRIVGAFVRVLLAVECQQPNGSVAMLTANGESLQLTYYERLQALLYGQVPRLQGMILEMFACAEKARNMAPLVTFNPEDYVLKEDVERLQEEATQKMNDKEQKLMMLMKELQAAGVARQQLGMDMKNAEASEQAEHQKLLTEKDEQIAALHEQVQAAARAREQLTQELQSAQEHRERERDTAVADKEAEMAALKKQVEAAERAREQLRVNLREVLDLKDNESREALSVKQEEVATLKNEIQAAELARKTFELKLKGEVQMAELARKKVEEDLKSQVEAAEQARKNIEDELKTKIEAAEQARMQVEAELKSEIEAAELARKKIEQELKSEVESKELARKMVEQQRQSEVVAAEVARKKGEEELKATRILMESEHTKRVKELEDELARTKLAVSEKVADARTDSLRQQRASFNANLVKDYVQHAKGDEPRKPRSASASDNQREDEELTTSARSSSTSSAASPRPSNEDLKKAKAEKEKLNARMRRVLGSRF